MASTERRTVVLVDGENIDATLGNTVLKRKPDPAERPRWDRLIDYAGRLWGQEVLGLFFLNASSGHLPGPFISALQGVGFRPVPLSGRPDQKVVDIGIQRTLDALVERPTDVLLCSHDGDFVEQVERLVGGEHRVGVVGFPELMSAAYTTLGVRMIDLETEVRAFNQTLPRVRVIPLDEFDPEAFLR
jgi:uncharacterized protein